MPNPAGYVPSFPHGIANPHVGEGVPTGGNVAWTRTPTTSHVYQFLYYDARKYGLIRKFGPQAGKSQLYVVFRDEKTGGMSSTYKYFFDDHDFGQKIADEMAASPHPYGEVLYPKVIQPKVIPYTRSANPA